MDLMSTAQLLGNFGEFLGAIAVVVTLIYLAGQLRQNTNALRTSAYQAYNNAAFSVADTLLQYNSDLIAMMQVNNIEELTEEQKGLLNQIAYKALVLTETNYLHHRAGSMDDDVFEAHMVGALAFVAGVPIMRRAWEDVVFSSTGGLIHDFVEYFTKRFQALDEAGAPTMSKLMPQTNRT